MFRSRVFILLSIIYPNYSTRLRIEDCENGRHCPSSYCCNRIGLKCLPYNQKKCKLVEDLDCVPCKDTTPVTKFGAKCGFGYCAIGQRCSYRGRCIPLEKIDCGNGGYCPQGQRCSWRYGHGCVPEGATECGAGKFCHKEFPICRGANKCVAGLIDRAPLTWLDILAIFIIITSPVELLILICIIRSTTRRHLLSCLCALACICLSLALSIYMAELIIFYWFLNILLI